MFYRCRYNQIYFIAFIHDNSKTTYFYKEKKIHKWSIPKREKYKTGNTQELKGPTRKKRPVLLRPTWQALQGSVSSLTDP